ncbi:MAG TPA: efflux RND transporter periplasmic adaptor subunit [Gemmatimonadales bacterium]|nr:efflux RND transporter periplasmic adaptor subunit [Gemmatimonadales bacterium]
MTSPSADLSRLRINRDAPPPEVRRALGRNVILVVLALALVLGIVFALRRGGAVPVQVVTVAAPGGPDGGGSPAGPSVTANGYVVARTRASVSAKLPGRIADLRVSEGSTLKRGEIIATLENEDYEAQAAQARASVATARAELVEARAASEVTAREAARLRDMRQENAELVSDQDLDAVEGRAAQAAARLEAADARLLAAQANQRFAQANLENTVIRAPFSGTVLRKEAEIGEVVAPSVGGGLTRGAVVTMADLTTLEVEVDVNEAYIARVRRAAPARITLDAYPDTSFRGEVRQVVPTADRQRATVQVKVSIVDRDPRILPEMGARVDFLEDSVATAGAAAPAGPPRFRVPAAAVREAGGESVVWLVRNGRLEPRTVQAGPVSAGFREIRSGLAGGEQLLVGGVEEPEAGMRVEVRQ